MSHLTLTAQDWEQMPSRGFAQWFSALEGMRSPVLIGSQDASGQHNLAIFNSLVHIGARPPLLGFMLRPLTVERHTYDNIKASRSYTINHIPQRHLDAAHQTSAKYGAGTSEFEAVGLTAEESTLGAPRVKEATVSMTLEFQEEHHIAANDTILMVGAVREIRVPAVLAKADAIVDWTDYKAAVVSGLYDYYSVKHLVKKAYAKTSE